MQKRTAKIVQQYYDAALQTVVTVYAARKQRKQITAKANSSTGHCGRTNVYGICV
jgi:hypothetical protein